MPLKDINLGRGQVADVPVAGCRGRRATTGGR